MEPEILDYYNELPSCFKTIEKLNEEFNILQKENNNLKDKLTLYNKPKIIYNNLEEWMDVVNNSKLLIETEINNIIIQNNGFVEIYIDYCIPFAISNIIENALSIITKHNNLPWCYLSSNNIINSLNAFIYSMKYYPSAILSNPEYLSDIILKHIEFLFDEIISGIPKFIEP